MTKPQLQVWTNDVEWIIAYSKEDAMTISAEAMGESYEQYLEDYPDEEWRLLPDWKVFSMHIKGELSDKHHKQIMEELNAPAEAHLAVMATYAQWIDYVGRGLLGSTEW
jgi:hypothetical protein